MPRQQICKLAYSVQHRIKEGLRNYWEAVWIGMTIDRECGWRDGTVSRKYSRARVGEHVNRSCEGCDEVVFGESACEMPLTTEIEYHRVMALSKQLDIKHSQSN